MDGIINHKETILSQLQNYAVVARGGSLSSCPNWLFFCLLLSPEGLIGAYVSKCLGSLAATRSWAREQATYGNWGATLPFPAHWPIRFSHIYICLSVKCQQPETKLQRQLYHFVACLSVFHSRLCFSSYFCFPLLYGPKFRKHVILISFLGHTQIKNKY